jgi:ligand-binding sensor domain-containing protein
MLSKGNQLLKCLLLFACSFFIRVVLMAQPVISKTFFIHLGNLQPRINCIIESSNGNFLTGTSSGLFLFNGSEFEEVLADSALLSKDVTALCEVRPGVVWMGFQNGSLAIYKNRIISRQNFEEGDFKKPVTKIFADDHKNIWCSTAGEGVYVYNGRKWINFNQDDGMSDNYVYDMAVAGKSAVVCGTDDGVNFLSLQGGKKTVRYAHDSSKSIDKIIRRIIPAGNQTFFAGTQSAFTGFFSLTDLSVKYPGTAPSNISQVNAIARTGNLNWVATQEDGVWYNDGSPSSCSPEFRRLNLSQNKVRGLLTDHQDNLWLFTENQLVKTGGNKLTRIDTRDTGYKSLHAMLATGTNSNNTSIWYDYNGGLKEIICGVNGKTISYVVDDLKNKAEITSLYRDNHGRTWIGTMGRGLWLTNLNGKDPQQINNEQLASGSNILSINGTGKNVWITSLEGIVKAGFSDGDEINFESFNNIGKLGTNYVYNVFTDSKNRTWFATDGKGITKLENGTFTSYSEKDGLKSKVIYTIVEDRNGTIWVNTLNDGLYYFDGKTFNQFSVRDGLSDNNISTLVEGKNGNIIALSKNAIDIIDPVTHAINTIDAEQGISEINNDLHSIAISPDGILYFSTSTGIYALNTTLPVYTPSVYIDHAELFLNDFNIHTLNEFKADENNLGIHFNAVDFDHPDKVHFSYMLEGFSNTWINTRDKYVNFPKLPPGHYTFRVRASLTPSFKYAPEVSYRFTILKPFWQRWWFIVLCVLFSAAFLWLLVRIREKSQHRWQQLKQESLQSQLETLKSQVSPHFFFNSLNTLVALIEESPKAAVSYTTHLGDFFRKMLQYRFSDLISLAEELEMIDDYYHIQKHRFEGSLWLDNSIDHSVAASKKVAPLTLQLLVENAIKHNTFTAAEPLVIKLFLQDEWLVVSNNRKQKLYPEPGAGVGLQNIMRRYKLLTGKEIIIENEKEYFRVSVPLI